ncbi:hypothetical protein [Streptomyces sp. GbtcB6]|uniref:hypothetical protein n=1 Tax=Streptomyces sp. GbtcB6 TaxID=2824751 RepID=UPI001C2F75C4|nr:hypothetical protein [Streptomyces sp. GbtcB6]
MPLGFRFYDLRHTGHTLSTRSGATLKDTTVRAGETRPVLAVIPVDTNGNIHIHNANGSLNVVADLEGYIG